MDINYYERQARILPELAEKSADKQRSFFQSLLISSVTLLGILISLHDNTIGSPLLRLLFATALVLLSLGILSTAIVLYDWSMIEERVRQKFVIEAQNALRENRPLNFVSENRKKFSVICEKITYIFLSCALFLLTTYAVACLFS